MGNVATERKKAGELFADPPSSPTAFGTLTAQQSKVGRNILKWSQVRLASRCGVSEGMIRDFENGVRTPKPNKMAAIRQAFEEAGVVFTDVGEPPWSSAPLRLIADSVDRFERASIAR
ncbi:MULTISPECIES: helix-turn-helix domain-containing protein [Mesorhizobium]|nr:helix-turn-helix transcriptional regulator [Mesorhizobium sp.]TIN90781.1 MAG: helix-turn-helix transcriptional regulator [Mesorhizobium sp.]TJU94223.1 MAG: helix-turn-helix transcriptional regulator [Mesorhizobium sp.]TJV44824.1 MAG: helix-turn-helix transcriptional regulator [Mesorhizobium sp.]